MATTTKAAQGFEGLRLDLWLMAFLPYIHAQAETVECSSSIVTELWVFAFI